MDVLFGLVALIFGCTLLGYKYRCLATVIVVAVLLRITASLAHLYVAPLPDGGTDAITFEQLAWSIGQDGFTEAVSQYPGPGSYFYAWLMGLVYACFGRSAIVLHAISVFIGILNVVIIWKITGLLWNRRAAKKAAWLAAVFPTLVLYSSLTLREVWVVFFLLGGTLFLVLWRIKTRIRFLIYALSSLLIGGFFHGGLMLLAGLLTLALCFIGASSSRLRVSRGIITRRQITALTTAVAFLFSIAIWDPALPKIGRISEKLSAENLISRFTYQQSIENAGAKYGAWQVPASPCELIWILPLKLLHFVFAPFPWQVISNKHLFGVLDASLYLWLSVNIWASRRRIFSDPATRDVFILLTLGLMIFSIGTGNFGAAVRHRAKFLALFIVLAAPKLLGRSSRLSRPRALTRYPQI